MLSETPETIDELTVFFPEILPPGIWKYAKWILWSCFSLFAFFFLLIVSYKNQAFHQSKTCQTASYCFLVGRAGQAHCSYVLSQWYPVFFDLETSSDRSVRMAFSGSSSMSFQICSDVRSLLVFLLFCFAFLATVEGASWAMLALSKCVMLTIETPRSVNVYFWIPEDLIELFLYLGYRFITSSFRMCT